MAGSRIRGAVAPVATVRVPERGHTDVPIEVWRRLATTPAFWHLVDQGIVSVSSPSRDGITLSGGCYVGQAMCGDVLLELHEKIPGALQALLRFAAHDAFEIAASPAPSSELGDLVVLLVKQFTAAVGAYAALGRQSVYSRVRSVGSLVGGRIRVVDTVRLRARGLGHIIAFERDTLSYDTPLNQVVLGALREIERIASVVAIPPADRAKARAFAMLFDDCSSGRPLHQERRRLLAVAEECAASEPVERLRDLSALAGVLLAHQSFERSSAGQPHVPRAWFLNLERLFEAACRAVFREQCRGRFQVERGKGRAPKIFELEEREFRAYPDLVIKADEAHAIGDVKYKHWTGSASASDLYQLLVHASAFETDCCFLVFPAESYSARFLGSAVTGSLTWLFAVDVRHLDRDLGVALDVMGLVATGAGSPSASGQHVAAGVAGPPTASGTN